MKITKAQLKQIIMEELGGYGGAADPELGDFDMVSEPASMGMEKKYAMALSTVLGISPEEVELMSPLEVSELGTSIRNHYRNKLNKRPPPLADPRRAGKYTPREG